jgi:hypothetical protein
MTTYSSSSAGAASVGPLGAIGGIVLLINVVGLFAFTGLAVTIFAYIAVTVLLMCRAGLQGPKSSAGGAGVAVLILSWMAALATGVCVGAFHWVKFPYAAYVTLGLYGLAVAIWLGGRVFGFLHALLFSSFGAALLAAVVCLPAPPGSEDPNDKENRTRVVARFVDEAGLPVEDVEVWFDLKWCWQDDPKLREKPDATSLMIDNCCGLPQGSAPWEAADDPRYKLLVIRARRGPHRGGEDAGYEDVRHEMLLPRRGQEYKVQLALQERPHPDVAFLDVTAEPRAGETPFIELLAGREPELPRTSYSLDFDALNSGWAGAHASSRSAFRGVLRIERELAGRPLFLHMDATHDGWKLAQPIEPMRLGERRRITLPVR